MLRSAAPSEIATPFGNGGSRNVIPVPSQIGVTAGAASFTDGFPPLTATDPNAGGIAPDVKDMNGILYAITQKLQWADAGGLQTYNSSFSTTNGGYPSGSVLQSLDLSGLWVSTADNNTTNPDTGGAGWVPLIYYGALSQSVSGSNITLSYPYAARSLIIVSGTLTANVVITFPAWQKEWTIVNYCTGSYTLSVKTPTGSPTTLYYGANLVIGDGSNILSLGVVTRNTYTSNQLLSASGYQISPGGEIEQWGTVAVPSGGNTGVQAFTFPIAFPVQCFGVVGNADKRANSGWHPVIVIFESQTTTGATMIADTGTSAQNLQSGINVKWRAKGK